MGLNKYRDEAGDFLARIGAEKDLEIKIKMLEEEFEQLKSSIDKPNKFNHQIYDMLFLLFEIASEANVDIDTEWAFGRIRKEQKYIRSIDVSEEIACVSNQ